MDVEVTRLGYSEYGDPSKVDMATYIQCLCTMCQCHLYPCIEGGVQGAGETELQPPAWAGAGQVSPGSCQPRGYQRAAR